MKRKGDRLRLDFEVNVADAGTKRSAVFSELIVRPTWVSVYMRNNTGSCDKQMISLAREWDAIRALGFDVLGLSKDTVGSHLKYAEKHSIGFPLVSDPDHQFAKATDSLVEKKMYGRVFWGPSRSAYLVDENAILLGVCEKVAPGEHGTQALAFLEGV